MQLQKASRKRVKIKMALQGPSGSGKTYSALLLAYGLCNDWSKIAVIDSENRSSELYEHLGEYNVLPITAPFSPEKYIEALQVCESAGMEVVIIDSISHEWEGTGGILEIHSQMPGNSYTNWNKLTPRHNTFIQHILQSPVHVIGTIRAKQEYILAEKNGKQVPEKVGMKGVTREGIDYEFTLVFEIDITNHASATKDRTSVYKGKPSFIISPETGQTILEWCNQGHTEKDAVLAKIKECKTINELKSLYNSSPSFQKVLLPQFHQRRVEIIPSPADNGNSSSLNKNQSSWN